MLAHALPVLTAPALRHRYRAHAACIAAPHAPCRCNLSCHAMAAHCSGTPRARAPAAAASAWRRAGPLVDLTPALKGAAKVCAVLASSRKRLPCAAGGASFSSPPSPPQGRYPARYAVSAAVGGPVNAACGRVAPASGWAASSFDSPVGQRNEPSLRFGLLALAPSAPAGLKVCSRLRPLHGFFQCFRPGRGEYSHA